MLGVVLFCLGFPDQALARSNAAIDEARNLAQLTCLVDCLSWGNRLISLAGDDAILNERADEIVAITTEQGFPMYGAGGTIYRGWSKVKNGDMADGISLLRSGLSILRALGQERGGI